MAFLILSLPRSRSAWLAHFLSYPPRKVGHDILVDCNCVEDFLTAYQDGMWGTVETGAMLGWKLFRHFMPDLKIITVRRSVQEVDNSLRKCGLVPIEGELESRDEMLNIISSLPLAEELDFTDLNNPDICRWLFEYCLELKWDEDWYNMLAQLNIQVDIKARAQKLIDNSARIASLKTQVAAMSKEIPTPWLM